jgi:O-antigen ligase
MLLIGLLPFDDYFRAVPNVLLILLAVVFPWVVKREDFNRVRGLPFVFISAFLMYLLLSAFFDGRLDQDFEVIQKVVLAAGLSVLYLPLHGWKKLNKALIFSSVAAIAFTVVNVFVSVNSAEPLRWADSAQFIEALLVDRLYLGLLSIVSILAAYRSISTHYSPDNRYYAGAIVLNVLFLLFIQSRIALGMLLLLFLLNLFYRKKAGRQLLVLSGFLAMVVVVVFAVNKDLRQHFFYTNFYNNEQGLVENALEKEPRALIWSSVASMVKEEGITWTGLGFEQTSTELLQQYSDNISDEPTREMYLERGYNTHNQYIDIYLSAGMLGLLLFLAYLLSLWPIRRRDYFMMGCWLVLLVYLGVENLFHRQIGAYYAGVLLVYLCVIQPGLNETKKTT